MRGTRVSELSKTSNRSQTAVSPSFGELLVLGFDSGRENPKGDRVGAFLESGVEGVSGGVEALFLQLDLPFHHPQFVKVWVQLARAVHELQSSR